MSNKPPIKEPETPVQPENDPAPNEVPEIDPQQPNEFPLESPTNPDTERKQEIVT